MRKGSGVTGIIESSGRSATRAVVSSGLAAIRVIPDRVLVAGSRRCVSYIPYPEGREFLIAILLLAKRHLKRMSPAVQESARNFIANTLVAGDAKRIRFKEETGFNPPILMVISPTMRCNLDCYGCYAGRYVTNGDLGLGTLERLLLESKEMGVNFITISGGEPFILGEDLLRVMERHPSILFQVYTNGTLIDRSVARRLAGMGNVYPCISVEGFEKETDARRGKGTYKKILSAMDDLREEGVIFGFSATATRENNELIISEEFVDFYRDMGCLIGWYFHYVPVGKEPGVELMPTAEQRIFRLQELRKRRARHNIILADFWNDGPLVGGCLAGGSKYLHINSAGDVEPCVFVHFAVDNIKNKSIKDILQSPFFNRIREHQPYDDNLFRPCMIIDVPEVMRDVVTNCGAHPTHAGAEAVIEEYATEIDEYAELYRALADTAWREYGAREK